MSGTIAAIATGVYAYSSYKQIQAQKEAGEAAERRFQAEQKKADIQNIRSVREQIRGARIAQASMVNQAGLTGGTGGSAVAGGTASIGSQLSGNLNYMSQIADQNTAINTAALQGSQAQTEGAIWGVVGSAAAATVNTRIAGRPYNQPTPPVTT